MQEAKAKVVFYLEVVLASHSRDQFFCPLGSTTRLWMGKTGRRSFEKSWRTD